MNGKQYSYVMRVTETGFLQHLYYGERIVAGDSDYLIGIGDTVQPRKEDINRDLMFNDMPCEYGFYAHGDFKEPTAIFERKDGASMSRLRYQSYCVQKGAPKLQGMPHVRTGDETLVITLIDDFSDIAVDLYYSVCENSDVLVRNAVVRNTGKEAILLRRALSFRMELPNGEYRSMRLGGTWGYERIPEIAPIAHGITRLHTLRGASSHKTNPFMGILKDGCREECGECYGIQLIYSGSFSISAEWCRDGGLCLQGGINETGFSWELAGGEEFVTPQVMLKVHTFGEQIKRVTVNGQEVAFKSVKKDISAFPLNAGDAAPDCDTLIVTLKTQIEKITKSSFICEGFICGGVLRRTSGGSQAKTSRGTATGLKSAGNRLRA